jgi:D-alanyl-D-alanine carboxypeptidase/D-alanyl-D-alanine-endopeptidase (penicillin-binding protein 4)
MSTRLRQIRSIATVLGLSLSSVVAIASRPEATTNQSSIRIAARDTLPSWLATVASGPLSRAHWGVAVYDIEAGRWIALHNADRFFVPASNLKLVVSAVALERLGPDFTYRTTVYATRPISSDGTLDGDLVLYGRGDPNLSGRHAPSITSIFEWLADSLVKRGLKRVTGDLIADESHWDSEYHHRDWSGFDQMWWYAAPVGALGFNDNSIDVSIRPGPRAGVPPLIETQPQSSFYSLDNLAVTGASGTESTFDMKREPGSNRITTFGELPLDERPNTAYVAVVGAADYSATTLRSVLVDRGVEIEGRVRTVSDPLASPVQSGDSIALANHRSIPLARVLESINGRSQNWHAEQVLKTLGREVAGAGTWKAGLEVERKTLAQLGMDTTAFLLRDASGLSPANLTTPRALAELLTTMRSRPDGDVFARTLSVAGQSGSLKGRFRGGAGQGRVRAKTGFIANVYALSGYMTTVSGREYAFSVFVNGAGSRANPAIDRLVEGFILGWAP